MMHVRFIYDFFYLQGGVWWAWGVAFLSGKSKSGFPNPKTDFAFLGGKSKNDHESIKSRLRADSSDQTQIRIFEIHNLSVFLGLDFKEVFLTSGFSKKEMVRDRSRTCMTFQLNLCWWRLIFKSAYLSCFLYVCSVCLRRFIFQVI